MSKQDEALQILRSLGLPRAQQNERSALTLLALAGLGPKGSWAKTRKPSLRIWDIMGFMRDKYGKNYAANSRETIRRQTIHQFEQARLVDRNADEPSRSTNSGNNCYCLTDAAITVLKTYGTPDFDDSVETFVQKFGQLEKAYNKRRDLQKVKLELPTGATIQLSPGKHNALQVAVVEELGPRFASGAKLLYLGDTARKRVVCETDELAELNVGITEHDKLPDIVLYHAKNKWLFLIEAVTTHGPVSAKRHAELETMLAECPAERIYVTAFLDKADFRRYAADIAWETEVWIAETPDHMIHFNGPKFLGPYKRREG
ncbi:MAG: BsuBI/PstI family type II restriction endonuclease [Thermoguttaceae bacterium]|jgi:adenine-specific DNA-methyltransferase